MFFNKKKSTGIFVPEGDKLVEYTGPTGKKSFNDIASALGYQLGQAHSIFTFDKPMGIECIGVLPLTKKVLFVITDDSVTKLPKAAFSSVLNQIDWEFEYSATGVIDILEAAVDYESWTVDFMNSIFSKKVEDDSVVESTSLGLYLYVSGGRLTSFSSADGLNEWARQMKELNPPLIQSYLDEAMSYHNDKERALEEVNLQASFWAQVPGGFDNDFTSRFLNNYGNMNFFLLYATYYGTSVDQNDFELATLGRWVSKSEKDGKTVYVVPEGRFVFEDGVLI